MKLYKVFTICAACSLILLEACSDDDPKTPLATVNGEVSAVNYTSLTFSWDNVAGATQYGYELYAGEDSEPIAGVTQDTFKKFSGLEQNTEYTLKVWAYAAVDGAETTSEPVVLKGTTLAAKRLANPVIETEIEGRNVSVSWGEVADVEWYVYELESGGEVVEEDWTYDCDLSFPGLDPGVYTLTVEAVNENDAFISSKSSVTIMIESEEIWRVTGTYNSVLMGASWSATLVAYSDNSYSLIDWYSTDGNNLNFYVDSLDASAPIKLPTSEYTWDADTEAYEVHIGRSGYPEIYVYPYKGCSLIGDKSSGTLTICVKKNNSSHGNVRRDTFTWGK